MRLLRLACLAAGFGLFAAGSLAAEDPFTVSGIKVDASAPSTVEAQTDAINNGREHAWQTLYRRLTKQDDWAHEPVLDPATLQRLVRSYSVHDARSSTTRFVASMTYVFNANAVRRILQQANIAYADATARPLLVIPLGPGWYPSSPWTRAWKDPRFAHGSVPLVLPLGDAVDTPALSALHFDSEIWQDIEPLASRVHAAEAYLALVVPQRSQMIVKIRRLGPGSSPSIHDVVVPVGPKTPPAKAFGTVADATASTVIGSWKARSVVDFGKKSRLVASMHFDSLQQWSAVLQKLGGVSTISEVNVEAMDIGEARIAISYAGSADQLSEQLGHEGLTLAEAGGEWSLTPSEGTAENR
jgi:hypothetical protein